MRITSTRRKLFALATLAGAALSFTAPTKAGMLDIIKQRGQLVCGVHLGLPGFGYADDKGVWRGLDIDYCRAISAAIFNDPTKIIFKPTAPKDRFIVVQAGEVDILARNATYTLSRDTSLGMNWPAINFFDGQGFIVRKSLNLKSAKELNGASVCVAQGTTTEMNLADFARSNGIKIETIAYATNEEGVKAFESGRCDSFTTDTSGLAAERLKFAKPDDFVVLPDVISKEPLGPAVRHGDEQWTDIVRWVHYAMLNAEEYGVTQANVDEMLKSTNPEIRRLLGVEGKFGEGMGLTNDWAYRIIKHVGNYGEAFERNVGPASPLKIQRGMNALYTKGGLQYAYPIR
ncbi:amino acid ABC transporter substrate-binding protein [Terrarubrum flagellatum]|uniref:amino acid ABC transporter substrate-binding protein n=1 Tax=Terrirubrum flagellatum TaxID=2895980 RepID=UPI003145039B